MVKNMTVKEEAYAYLTSIKQKNESYSDVILRLKKSQKQNSLLDLFGSCPQAKQIREEIEKNWK